MAKKLIKVGIAGISGYSGLTALEILLNHPHVRVTYVSANNTTGKLDDIWPRLAGQTKLTCKKFSQADASKNCDVVFLAVPHTIAMTITPGLLKAGLKVIDLSGDYRLDSRATYKKWYKTAHKDAAHLQSAVYGLPELYREKIRKAALIANPGCYPTAAILGIAPIAASMTKSIDSITIDAKSGTSGAGRKANTGMLYSEVTENFKAYKVLNHQHTPEIAQYLSSLAKKELDITFVPHLLPCDRGILETIYIRLKQKTTQSKIHDLYRKFYKTEPFVRLLPSGQQPELKNVTHSNFCDIGIAASQDGRLVVITSVIDNLVKGAAGQAVQNMNLMYGFNETEGLK